MEDLLSDPGRMSVPAEIVALDLFILWHGRSNHREEEAPPRAQAGGDEGVITCERVIKRPRKSDQTIGRSLKSVADSGDRAVVGNAGPSMARLQRASRFHAPIFFVTQSQASVR